MFLIHVPYVFWAAYRIIYPFIDPVTRHKVGTPHGMKAVGRTSC